MTTIRRRAWTLTAAVALAALLFAQPGAAQEWPTKQVRLVVPYPPGGGNDILARLLAPRLTERWKQTVVVDNRPGAAGNLGAAEVARSAPDGHTLLIATSTIAMTPGLEQKVGYDLASDLTAVAMIGATSMVIAVNQDVPAKSLRELIALAKSRSLAYSTCGMASPMHLAGELFKLGAGIDMLHVPYKGCAPALIDVIGGQVPVAFNTIANTVAHEKAGRLRILAVASNERLADFPNLPTAAEQGMTGYAADIWFGLFAPAATPRAATEAVNGAVNQALGERDLREKMRAQYFEPRPTSVAAYQKFVSDETAKWTRTIRAANIKAE